jgi:hypothetical protein
MLTVIMVNMATLSAFSSICSRLRDVVGIQMAYCRISRKIKVGRLRVVRVRVGIPDHDVGQVMIVTINRLRIVVFRGIAFIRIRDRIALL